MTAWMSLSCQRCAEALTKILVFMGNSNTKTCVFLNHLKPFLAFGETGTTVWGCHSRHFWLRFVHLRLLHTWGRWIKWLSWCLWNSGEQTNPAQGAMPKAWCQNRDWFKGECPLCPFHAAKQTIYAQGIISKLKTSWWEGMSSSEDNFGKFTKKLSACDDCWWWFLVVASQIWSHRQLPTKQRSWCPVGVQVSLMLLVVEELVGCASPFLDQDSTLISRCVKSTLLAFYQPKKSGHPVHILRAHFGIYISLGFAQFGRWCPFVRSSSKPIFHHQSPWSLAKHVLRCHLQRHVTNSPVPNTSKLPPARNKTSQSSMGIVSNCYTISNSDGRWCWKSHTSKLLETHMSRTRIRKLAAGLTPG